MNHIIHSSGCAVFLAVLIMVVSATGCDTGGPVVLKPEDAGQIEGESEIVKGGTVVLSVEAIRYATSYRWYKDGFPVQDSGDRMLDVTLPGVYTVAGVNAFGEGVHSPAKEILEYVRPQMFVDRLIGDWKVEEILVIDGKAYINDHVVNIEYIDDTKVSISNFSNANTRPETDFGDTVTAVVDNDVQTLKIITKELVPSWSAGYATRLAPAVNDDFTKNIDLDFPVQSFNENGGKLQLVMKTGHLEVNIENRMCPVTYHVSAVSGSDYAGTFGYFVDTTWTKM